MKIIEEKRDDGISLSEMKDNDIAIIINWPSPEYIGLLVKRSNKFLFSLSDNNYWSNIFNNISSISFRVRILSKGTKLEV